MRSALSVAVALFTALACAPMPILAPTKDAHGCNLNMEHDCSVGCCLQGWTCGGTQPGRPVTCPDGYCCDNEDNPPLASKRAPTLQRRP
jgi:hypothetical protein